MNRPCAGSRAPRAQDPAAVGTPWCPPGGAADPVRFGTEVVLTKVEVFDLCDLLGRIGGHAWALGGRELAVAAGAWVGELEDRLTALPAPPPAGTERGAIRSDEPAGTVPVSPGRTRATAS